MDLENISYQKTRVMEQEPSLIQHVSAVKVCGRRVKPQGQVIMYKLHNSELMETQNTTRLLQV